MRFVWKCDEDDDWEDFAFDVVHFGDCCAATQLEVGKDLTADAGWEIDPEAAQRVKDDTYGQSDPVWFFHYEIACAFLFSIPL